MHKIFIFSNAYTSFRACAQGISVYDKDVTFFYAPQTGDKEDCTAAITYWRGGITVVNGSLPPAYTEGESVYKDARLLGLVGMFNPKRDPVVRCQYVVCSDNIPSGQDDGSGGGGNEGGPLTRGAKAGPELEGPEKDENEPGDTFEVIKDKTAKSAHNPQPTLEALAKEGVFPSEAAACPAGTEALPPSFPELPPEVEETQPAAPPSWPENSRRLSATDTYKALVCTTAPPALVLNEKPFE